jgi:hypothetical protein
MTLQYLLDSRKALEEWLRLPLNPQLNDIVVKQLVRVERELATRVHDVFSKEYESEYGHDDHNAIVCKRCKRVLAVDDEVGDPLGWGLCTPIPEGAKTLTLIG